jgi:uncharacterized membrane protein
MSTQHTDERTRRRHLLRVRPLDPKMLHHPAVIEQYEKRAEDAQLRVADKITAFAGSMNFVYLHIVLFAVWMLVFEKNPWPTLTLIVSLEAIFLSTFVMIGQNRQAAFQQAKADNDYANVNTLLDENTRLTRLIHELTLDIHQAVIGNTTASDKTHTSGPAPGGAADTP